MNCLYLSSEKGPGSKVNNPSLPFVNTNLHIFAKTTSYLAKSPKLSTEAYILN